MKRLLAALFRTAAERLDGRRTVDEQWHLDSVAATNRYVERSERFIALLERQVRRVFVKTARDQTGHVAANDETRYPGGVLGELKRADLDAIMAREQIKDDVITRLLDSPGELIFGADFAAGLDKSVTVVRQGDSCRNVEALSEEERVEMGSSILDTLGAIFDEQGQAREEGRDVDLERVREGEAKKRDARSRDDESEEG